MWKEFSVIAAIAEFSIKYLDYFWLYANMFWLQK